jgi:hypothetical protein
MNMRELMTLVEASTPPAPRADNIADAIDHADHEGNGWSRKDFSLHYVGLLSVDEIEQYDDVSAWLEVDDEGDIDSFRSGSFAGRPTADALPPIILITAPDEDTCHTQIGDGRGRVNYAHAMKIKLHVWNLVHRDCSTD